MPLKRELTDASMQRISACVYIIYFFRAFVNPPQSIYILPYFALSCYIFSTVPLHRLTDCPLNEAVDASAVMLLRVGFDFILAIG